MVWYLEYNLALEFYSLNNWKQASGTIKITNVTIDLNPQRQKMKTRL